MHFDLDDSTSPLCILLKRGPSVNLVRIMWSISSHKAEKTKNGDELVLQSVTITRIRLWIAIKLHPDVSLSDSISDITGL